MKKDEIQTLFDYNLWATGRVLETAVAIDDVQFAAPADFPHGGLRGTLVHLVSSEWIWRTRLQEGQSPQEVLSERNFPTLEAIRRRWEAEQSAWRGYLDSLQDEYLGRVVQYQRTNGQPQENILWHILVHLVNHGTQHRSEAAALLTEYGHSPGDLDMIRYFRSVGRGSVLAG